MKKLPVYPRKKRTSLMAPWELAEVARRVAEHKRKMRDPDYAAFHAFKIKQQLATNAHKRYLNKHVHSERQVVRQAFIQHHKKFNDRQVREYGDTLLGHDIAHKRAYYRVNAAFLAQTRPELILDATRAYEGAHPNRKKGWIAKNREKHNDYQRAYQRERLKDPAKRLAHNKRQAVYAARRRKTDVAYNAQQALAQARYQKKNAQRLRVYNRKAQAKYRARAKQIVFSLENKP